MVRQLEKSSNRAVVKFSTAPSVVQLVGGFCQHKQRQNNATTMHKQPENNPKTTHELNIATTDCG